MYRIECTLLVCLQLTGIISGFVVHQNGSKGSVAGEWSGDTNVLETSDVGSMGPTTSSSTSTALNGTITSTLNVQSFDDHEEDPSETNAFTIIEDEATLNYIMEQFMEEYAKYEKEYLLGITDGRLTDISGAPGAEFRIFKGNFINFCKLPAPKSITKIFPGLRLYRRDYATVTINDYITANGVYNKIANILSGAVRTIFVTHGFTANINTPWLYDIKNEILKYDRRDQVVVVVGWGSGAAPGNRPFRIYRQAAANTETIGRYIGSVASMIRTNNPNMQIYGIGHSLGSHVMGWAGRSSGNAFNRITGLDPAGPCFERDNPNKRLSRTDASTVEAIHTDGYTNSIPFHFGTLLPLGDLDFYPNFGQKQPGCGLFSFTCSHSRAIDLYIWSIGHQREMTTSREITGTINWYSIPTNVPDEGPNTAELGYYADAQSYVTTGRFYIATNGPPNFI